MVMDTLQIRITPELVKYIDSLIKRGLYSNRADVIRDAIRKMALEQQVGSIPNTGDSVKEVRKIRKNFSEEFKLGKLKNIG